jgi:hypothetical protein
LKRCMRCAAGSVLARTRTAIRGEQPVGRADYPAHGRLEWFRKSVERIFEKKHDKTKE